MLEFFKKIRLRHIFYVGIFISIALIALILGASFGSKGVVNFFISAFVVNDDETTTSQTLTEESLTFLRIDSGPPSEAIYALAGALSAGVSRPPGSSPCDESNICGVPGLIAVAQSTSGPIENVLNLAKNSTDAILVPFDVAYFAHTNSSMFKDQSDMGDIRIIAALTPLAMQIFVRSDSDILNLRDLYGKRIVIGSANSGEQKLSRFILKTVGIEDATFTAFEYPAGRAFDLMAESKVDAIFILSPPPIRILDEADTDVQVRLLNIDKDTMQSLYSLYPFFSEKVLPIGLYEGMDKEVTTVEIELVLAVLSSFPVKLAHDLTKAVWQGQTRLLFAQDQPKIAPLDINRIQNIPHLQIHPGAKLYYQERGLFN